jgi:hypothetical protein
MALPWLFGSGSSINQNFFNQLQDDLTNVDGRVTTNTTNIATNTANIATNTADITTLQTEVAAIDAVTTHTWTPTLTFATPGDLSVVYSTRTGFYTKIGNLVFLKFEIVTSTFIWTTAAGDLHIDGFPLAVTNGVPRGAGYVTPYTKAGYTQHCPALPTGASPSIIFETSGSGLTLTTIVAVDLASGTNRTVRGSITAWMA